MADRPTISLVRPRYDYEEEYECSFETVPPEKRAMVYEALDQVGFYRRASQQDRNVIQNYLYKYGDCFADETHNVFTLDGEDVHEQGLDVLFASSRNVLAARGYEIPYTVSNTEDDFGVEIEGQRFIAWTMNELRDRKNDLWKLCSDRAMMLLNLLWRQSQQAGTFYYDYSGNDTTVALLTEEEKAVFERHQILLRTLFIGSLRQSIFEGLLPNV